MQPKERPIIFNGEMVRRILAGKKTQTRRLITPQPVEEFGGLRFFRKGGKEAGWHHLNFDMSEMFCPHGKRGDRLFVRETWQYVDAGQDSGYVYRASENGRDWEANDEGRTWKPSIFMPREASRILLEIDEVRCERLQDTSEADAVAEGLEWYADEYRNGREAGWQCYPKPPPGVLGLSCRDPRYAFRTLWESIHGPISWELNPWVWTLSFHVLT